MDLGEGLRKAIARLTNATIIDSQTIKEFNKELQKTLLSADVEVKLVFALTSAIEEKALKSKPPKGLPQRDYITDIVYEELVQLMGKSYFPELKPKKIILAGLYGSGKTTTAAKLAKFYQDRGLSAGLICCDVTRPAAYEQLESLAKQANVAFFGIKGESDAAKIAKEGLRALSGKKVIICDTSGRNALDGALISELVRVSKAFNPDERILVISADMGQTTGKQAREFDRAIGISGIILTKADGSAKGGGALSAASAAHANVMFLGTGEKLGDLHPFDSAKFIGNLLGVPDIEALSKAVEKAVAESGVKPEELESEELNFETFYSQLKAMGKMGSLKSVFGMMGAPDIPKEMLEKGEDKLKLYHAMISSMTKEERRNEKLLHEPGRIQRIAHGSGTTEKEVHAMISEFNKMKKIFNTFKNDRSFRKRFAKFM
ncbi:MAG: signal recognition particle receptor subunit alpha [Candidatus Micrarchaeaceae archaeon]